MGIRPSTGGFLNGVDVTLEGYQWQAKSFEGKDGAFTPYSLELHLKVDGADEAVKTWLRLGNGEDGWGDGTNITEDGLRLMSTRSPGSQSAVGIFLNSFKQAGYAENFADDDHADYLSLENFTARKPRFRVVQEVNVEKTQKFGQQKSRKDPSKSYDRRDFKVEKWYGFTVDAPKVGNGAAPADVAQLAQQTLSILMDNAPNGELTIAQIRTRGILRLGKHPKRDEVVKAMEARYKQLHPDMVPS